MRLDDDALVFVTWDAELSADPTGSTVELEVDGVRRSATWQGSPVQSGSSWRQTARTNGKLGGTNSTPGGSDVKLTAGRHMAQFIVTTADGQVVPATEFPIDVR